MRITNTLVLGAGGTGGYLIPPLARLLTYHPEAASSLHVADGDSFEEANATRQICGPADIGLNKAAALANHCAAQGVDTVVAHEDYMDRPGVAQWLTAGGDCPLVIAAVDNHATRRATLEALECSVNDWLWVSPGNSDGIQDIHVNVFWWGRLRGTTYGMDPRLVYDEIQSNASDIPRRGSCATHAPSRPQLLAANLSAAALALGVVQNFLDDQLPPSTSAVIFNGRSLKATCN